MTDCKWIIMEVLKLIKRNAAYSVRASPAECRTRLADSGKMMLKLLTAVTYQWGII